MPRILFVAEDVTLAHVARPLALARGLDGARFEVGIASGPRYRDFIEAAGFTPLPLSTIAPATFARRLARGQPVYTRGEIEAYVREELALFERVRPDVVVGDFRISLGISAEVARVPYVAVASAYWSPYSTQPFPLPEHPLVSVVGVRLASRCFDVVRPLVFRHHARAFDAVRRSRGLPGLGTLERVYTHGTWTLYPDLPRLAPTARLPPHHRYIGPVIWEPDVPGPDGWETLPADRPVVYVSLGSSGRPGLLAPVLDGLQGLGVTLVVATAGQAVKTPRSEHVFVAPYLPGRRVAARARLVVGNGGSPTNYQALSCGVPVLGLPANADQYLSMGGVVREEAGLLVRSGKATPARVRKAAQAILGDGRYRARAEALAREMGTLDAPASFARFVDSVVDGTAPPPPS